MEFMGTKEASEKWGVTQNTVSRWCRDKKIPKVEQDAKGSPGEDASRRRGRQ